MAKYYMLECYGPDTIDRAGIGDVEGLDGVTWMLGQRFSQPIPSPIKVTLDADDGIMMPMFNRGILLFSDALISALHQAGVNNLDLYDCMLTNPKTKATYDNYKAANILGLVAAADMANSKYQAHSGLLTDVDFDSLVIDESRARNLLMFRLAECVSGIVVNEHVKDVVDANRIPYLDWLDPSEWVG